MITKYRWIEIVELPQAMPTRRFEVKNIKSGFTIGWIRWYGPFRSYAYLPCEGTVYEEDCLRDLAECVEGLTKEHKAKKHQLA
jgi:CRISPR/Cas system CMR-associated protein Cmr1 (group 7 of RAMP superfamily)